MPEGYFMTCTDLEKECMHDFANLLYRCGIFVKFIIYKCEQNYSMTKIVLL